MEAILNMKENAIILQQKSHRVSIQLQNQIDKETENLLQEGRIERIDVIHDDSLTQPTVITVKKDKSNKLQTLER